MLLGVRFVKTVPLRYKFKPTSPRDADTAKSLFLVVCSVPAVCEPPCLLGKRFSRLLGHFPKRHASSLLTPFCPKKSNEISNIFVFLVFCARTRARTCENEAFFQLVKNVRELCENSLTTREKYGIILLAEKGKRK